MPVPVIKLHSKKRHNGELELNSMDETNDKMPPLPEQKAPNQTQVVCQLGVDSVSGAFRDAVKPFSGARQTRLAGERLTHKTKRAMKGDIKFYKAEYTINDDAPRIKKLNLRLAVTDCDLGNEVRKAFELARIAGQELDLFFSHATS